MLCFLCSFAKGPYCYCRPRRQVTVISTLDMLVIDTSPNLHHVLCRRRTRSEPGRQTKSSKFARFQSLREGKVVRRDWRRPIRVDVVSIPSSADSDRRHRKARREQARRRWEVQPSSSSSSSSSSSPTSLSMVSLDAPQSLVVERRLSVSTSDASCEESTSAELAIADESTNRSNFALLVSGMAYGQRKGFENLPALNLEDCSVIPKKIPSTVIDRLHLELVHLPDNQPNGYFRNVSYLADMEKFAQGNHLNHFMDPFEEERRLSRTEVWVESTSPGYPSDHDEGEAIFAVPSGECLETLEAKVVEVPEKSVSTSPPCNTTTSTTGVDEELSPAVRAHKNEDLLPNVKIPKIELSRMKSSTTSEKSESNSLVSSDLDKTSIVKLRFNCNLHRAREDAKREVDMNAFDRFWRYYYKKNDTTDGATGSSQSERKDSCRNRHHGHPSTIDRVVMYYTSTRRPSATPSLSLLSHSSEPPTERSHHSDTGADLFVQRRKCMLAVQQDPLTSEPSGNTAMSHDKTSTHCMSDTSSNSDELIGNGHFFLLSETSGSDSDHGEVVIENVGGEPALLRPSTFSRATRDLLEDKSTSTADLDPSILDISSSDRRGLENTYKRTVRDKSTVTSPMLDYIETSSKKEMRDQMTSTSSSFLSSSSLPVVVLEDTPEMDASLPDFKDQLTDLESSSMEDLLAIDTRPSSSNRKSVTFGDTIDIDVVAQEYRMRSPSPDNRHITVKPILKKEDKQRESMRRLLGYVAERLYKDLLMLVEERDRSIHALELTSSDQDAVVFSVNSTIFQQKYRDKLLENKFALDQRIEQVWSKLKDMALDGAAAQFVNGVRHSSELTLNVKRRLLDKRESHPVTHRKPRSEFEMACDFSRRLSQIREQMVRRDSETFDDNRSMEELMCAMSRIMTG